MGLSPGHPGFHLYMSRRKFASHFFQKTGTAPPKSKTDVFWNKRKAADMNGSSSRSGSNNPSADDNSSQNVNNSTGQSNIRVPERNFQSSNQRSSAASTTRISRTSPSSSVMNGGSSSSLTTAHYERLPTAWPGYTGSTTPPQHAKSANYVKLADKDIAERSNSTSGLQRQSYSRVGKPRQLRIHTMYIRYGLSRIGVAYRRTRATYCMTRSLPL